MKDVRFFRIQIVVQLPPDMFHCNLLPFSSPALSFQVRATVPADGEVPTKSLGAAGKDRNLLFRSSRRRALREPVAGWSHAKAAAGRNPEHGERVAWPDSLSDVPSG